MAATLKYVWSLNHVIQLMSYYRHFTNWSANCAMIMVYMHNSVTLENVNDEVKGYFKDKLAIVKESVESQEHKEKGLSSNNFFESFAIYGLILAILVVLLLVYLLIKLFKSTNKHVVMVK